MKNIGEEEKCGMMTGIRFLLGILLVCLFIMIVMATSVFALEFTFDSPQNIGIDEEFDVTINANVGNDIYDVKIFVYQETKGNIVSEVFYDGEWKNPWFYLQDVFPATSVFKNKVLENVGETEICVRLRKQDSGGFDEVCESISVGENTQTNNNINLGSNNDNTNSGQDDLIDNVIIDDKTDNLRNDEGISNNNVALINEKNNEKIVLGFVEEEKNEEKRIITKQEKVRQGVLYSFLGFLGLLVILLAWRKL
jgi:hypothetical protein